MPLNRERTSNIARRKAATVREAIAAANRQIWQREFNPDYDQVVLRISTAPFDGLRNGSPPPRVQRRSH